MKTYFSIIKTIQSTMLAVSILLLMVLPSMLALFPGVLDVMIWYFVAHVCLFFVMMIRPLADIVPGGRLLRPLVILRKGIGVFSASIIVSCIIAKIIVDPVGYFAAMGEWSYWSLSNLALCIHLADISAVLLLITSNNFSKKVLGSWWKRVQRLSYVYFYGSSLYLFFILGDTVVVWYLVAVTIVTSIAYLRNRTRA